MLNDRIKGYEEMKNDNFKKLVYLRPAKYKKDNPFLKEMKRLVLRMPNLI